MTGVKLLCVALLEFFLQYFVNYLSQSDLTLIQIKPVFIFLFFSFGGDLTFF